MMVAHEAADLLPMLSDAELDALADDIATHGQREPIVILGDKLLDGRNRLAACRRAGVEPRVRILESCASPLAFVISANLHRRHLSAIQRAACAVEALAVFRAEAESRAREGRRRGGKIGGRGRRKVPAQTAPYAFDGKATHQAARAFRAGERSVEYLAAVKRRAPEVFAAAKTGLVVRVTDAVALAKLAPTARLKALQAIEAGGDPRNAISEQRRAARVERVHALAADGASLDRNGERFAVIYADPPWRYEHAKSASRAIENVYPTMELEAIRALPVDELAADDAVLFLWATSPKIADAMRVIEAWGFTYRTSMVWVKDQIGMGYYARQRHELLLVAVRGALPVPLSANRPDSVVESPVSDHSAKPNVFAELIERMYPEHKRIELFCRTPRRGWSHWGNEVGRFVLGADDETSHRREGHETAPTCRDEWPSDENAA